MIASSSTEAEVDAIGAAFELRREDFLLDFFEAASFFEAGRGVKEETDDAVTEDD